MAIKNFYLARSLDEALSLLGTWGEQAQVIAGGTDIMVALRNGSLESQKTCLIDVSHLSELSYIRPGETGMTVEIGSGTRHATIAVDGLVARSSLILGRASGSVGSPQIRNRGTIGGNILTAAQCADTIPALLALNAELSLMDASGATRILPIADFFPKPKETAIRPNELLLSIRYQRLDPRPWKGSYYKLIRRAAVAKARLNFATLALVSDAGIIEDARISIGSTIPTPGRFSPVEAVLRGQRPSQGLVEGAADACVDYLVRLAGRRWSSEYKEMAMRNIIRRELTLVLGLEAHHA
jgi:CO/xanthine dehydrogenase FAD-binding subunit